MSLCLNCSSPTNYVCLSCKKPACNKSNNCSVPASEETTGWKAGFLVGFYLNCSDTAGKKSPDKASGSEKAKENGKSPKVTKKKKPPKHENLKREAPAQENVSRFAKKWKWYAHIKIIMKAPENSQKKCNVGRRQL